MADYVQTVASQLSSTDLKPATTPTMALVDCVLADTEYPYNIPAGTRKFAFYLLGAAASDIVKYYWVAGGANYGELYGNESNGEDNVLLTGKTLYFKVSVPAKKVHISTWQ